MILNIIPFHSEMCNCVEDALVSILKWIDLDFSFMFLKTLRFPADYSIIQNDGYNYSLFYDEVDLLNEVYNFNITLHQKEYEKIIFDKIVESLNYKMPVPIMIDQYYLPWSKYYQKKYVEHCIVITGINLERNIFHVIDCTLMKDKLELSFDLLLKNITTYYLIENKEIKKINLPLQNQFYKIVDRVKEDMSLPTEKIKNIEPFTFNLNNYISNLNINNEIDIINSEEIKYLQWLSRGRYKFAFVLNHIFKEYINVDQIINYFNRSGLEWNNIKNNIIRYCLLNEVDSKKESIFKQIEKLSKSDAEEYNNFTGILNLNSFNQKLVNTKAKNKSYNLVKCKELDDHFNNFAFYSINAGEKGFDGEGFFYAPKENLIDNEIVLYNQKLLLHRDGRWDNVSCCSQQINFEPVYCAEIWIMGSATQGNCSAKATLCFADRQIECEINFSDWWESIGMMGDKTIFSTKYIDNTRFESGQVSVFLTKIKIERRLLKSIILPQLSRIHIFAIYFVNEEKEKIVC